MQRPFLVSAVIFGLAIVLLLTTTAIAPVICGDPRVPIPPGWDRMPAEEKETYCWSELSTLEAQDLGIPQTGGTPVYWPELTEGEKAQVAELVLADVRTREPGKRIRLLGVRIAVDDERWDLSGPCTSFPPRCAGVTIFNYTDNEGIEYLVHLGPPVGIVYSHTIPGAGYPLSGEEQLLAVEIAKKDPVILTMLQAGGFLPEAVMVAQANPWTGDCAVHRCVLVTFGHSQNNSWVGVFVDLNEERVAEYIMYP